MTTIQINERSKAGKALLELARFLSKEQNGVKIIEPETEPTPKSRDKDYPVSKNVPNAETLKAMKETKERRGLSKPQSLDEFLKEVDTW